MRKSRRAFSMLVAIFTILILSLVSSYIFYSSATINKEGEVQYQKEQAILLARSYTEYAVMAIEANDYNTNCIDNINATIGTDPSMGMGYLVEVKIRYIGNSKYITKCQRIMESIPSTDTDTLSVIIDVYVKYKDRSNESLYNGYSSYVPWFKYHKRSLQKI